MSWVYIILISLCLYMSRRYRRYRRLSRFSIITFGPNVMTEKRKRHFCHVCHIRQLKIKILLAHFKRINSVSLKKLQKNLLIFYTRKLWELLWSRMTLQSSLEYSRTRAQHVAWHRIAIICSDGRDRWLAASDHGVAHINSNAPAAGDRR